MIDFHLNFAVSRQRLQGVDWQNSLTPATTLVGRIATQLLCQVCWLVDSVIADELGQCINQVVWFLRLIAIAKFFEHVSKAHYSQTNCPRLVVWVHSFRNRRLGDIYQVIQLAHCCSRRFFESIPIPRLIFVQKGWQIDTHQVTSSDIVFVLRQGNFRTEIGQVNRTCVIVQCSHIDGVFPGKPRVAGSL